MGRAYNLTPNGSNMYDNDHHHPSPIPESTTTTTTNPSAHNNHHYQSNSLRFKIARSKYDRMKYHSYIPKYDHYCYWMNNTFGEENYRYFILFLIVHASMCIYGSIIIGILFYNDIYIIHQYHVRTFIDTLTNIQIPVTTYILFQYLVTVYMYEIAVLLVLIVMSMALTLFLGYHIYITTFTGLTSHEMYKWNQIQKWYRTELQ
jgi:palmitoyltransferase ZDHHC4